MKEGESRQGPWTGRRNLQGDAFYVFKELMHSNVQEPVWHVSAVQSWIRLYHTKQMSCKLCNSRRVLQSTSVLSSAAEEYSSRVWETLQKQHLLKASERSKREQSWHCYWGESGRHLIRERSTSRETADEMWVSSPIQYPGKARGVIPIFWILADFSIYHYIKALTGLGLDCQLIFLPTQRTSVW